MSTQEIISIHLQLCIEKDSCGILQCINCHEGWQYAKFFKLLIKYFNNYLYIIGVTSWGILCGAPKWPGIYTDLTRYINWIRDQAQDVGLQLDS